MNKLVLLLALLAAAQLPAFEATIKGTVSTTTPAALEKTQVSVVFDELWGFKDAATKAIDEQRNGALPVATVRGEATADDMGSFTLTVVFEFPEGTTPPRTVIRKGTESVATAYVTVWVAIRHEQFQTQWVRHTVQDGAKTQLQLAKLAWRCTIKGKVVHLADRSPAAGVELALQSFRHRWSRQKTPFERYSWKFKADAAGAFEFTDEYLSPGQYRMVPAGGQLAFPKDTIYGSAVNLGPPVTDMGTLHVIPGGALRGTLVLSSVQHATANARLKSNLSEEVHVGSDGSIVIEGLIAGTYELTLSAEDHWRAAMQVEVKNGEWTDIGVVSLEPLLSLEIVVDGDPNVPIYQFEVRVTAIVDEAEMTPRDSQFSGRLHNRQGKIGPLRSGTWLLVVEAHGHCRTEMVISLPAEGPVVVKLETGGAIRTFARKENGDAEDVRMTWAVREDSGYARKLAAMPRQTLSTIRLDERRPEVHKSQGRSENLVDQLPPGKYLVFVATSGAGWQYRWGVEVRKGDTTSVEIRKAKPNVRVVATRRGVRAPDERLYLAVLADHEEKLEFVEGITDSNGVMDAELPTAGTCFAATAHDRAYLDLAWKSHHFPVIHGLEAFWLPGAKVYAGGAADLNFELEDPKKVRLALEIRVPSGVEAHSVILVQDEENREKQRGTGLLVDGLYLFPPVPPGAYEVAAALSAEIVGQPSLPLHYRRSIEVKGPGPAQLVVEFNLLVLRVNLRYSVPRQPGLKAAVNLQPGPIAYRGERHFVPDQKGQVVIVNPPDSRIVISGSVFNGKGELLAAGRRTVDPRIETEVTVALSTDIGTLRVEVVGNPAIDQSSHEAEWQVRLYTSTGQEVPLDSPGWRTCLVNVVGNIAGVPVGEYRAVVVATGLQPVTIPRVRVMRGETTPISVTPEPACLLRVTLSESIVARGYSFPKTTIRYLNESGQEVDPALPDSDSPSSLADRRILRIRNLQPGVTTVVVKIEGYEEFRVPVQVKAGVTILETVELKPSTD